VRTYALNFRPPNIALFLWLKSLVFSHPGVRTNTCPYLGA
jgi:hypothetical protein